MKRAMICKEPEEVVSPIDTQSSGSSFSDLPREILLNILLRLSIKRILVSKCVCKTWYDLVCSHEFAKLHFDQAEVYPLIRGLQSKMVYLLQPDNDDFEVKLGMCDHTRSMSGCVCNVQVELNTKFRVLERNKCVDLRKKDLRFKYSVAKNKGYNYSIANSCNGYICLFDPSNRCPPIVCNPVTGEFINLLDSEKFDFKYCYNTHYGFGYSPANNQYKVIRMSARGIDLSNMAAEVHILGTNTWKNIGFFTHPIPKLSPTYLNGFLYWSSDSQLSSVFSFDIQKEQFGSVLAPREDRGYQYGCVSVGVLGGELCICRVSKSGAIHVWVMKDHSTKKEWSKVFSFNVYSHPTRYSGPFQPIKYLNDGALLMFHSYTNSENMDTKDALLYMDSKRNRFRFLKIHGMNSAAAVEVIAHTPSFVSLEHALSGQNVKVDKFMSRCTEFKLHEKTKEIAIVEEEFYPDTNWCSDLDYSSDSENDIDYYL